MLPYSGKLSRIGEKYGFRGLLACAASKNATPQILRRKLLQIATKPRNSQKIFPSKVSRYMVFYCAVITGGELSGLSLLNVRGKKPGRDTFLSPWEEQQCYHAIAEW